MNDWVLDMVMGVMQNYGIECGDVTMSVVSVR